MEPAQSRPRHGGEVGARRLEQGEHRIQDDGARLRHGGRAADVDRHALVLEDDGAEGQRLEQPGQGHDAGLEALPELGLRRVEQQRVGGLDGAIGVGPRGEHDAVGRIEVLAGEERLVGDQRPGGGAPLVRGERGGDHEVADGARVLGLHPDGQRDETVRRVQHVLRGRGIGIGQREVAGRSGERGREGQHQAGIGAMAAGHAGLPQKVKLTLANPNAPPAQDVLNTPDGLVALAVGMQAQYAGAVGDFVIPPSLTTDEWGTTTRSLIAYQSRLTGQNFDASYGVVLAPWADAYRLVKSPNALLLHAPEAQLGEGLEAGIVSLARLFKALALGTIVLEYQSVPIDVGGTAPVPEPRSVVLDTVLALLESARADFTAVPRSALGGF